MNLDPVAALLSELCEGSYQKESMDKAIMNNSLCKMDYSNEVKFPRHLELQMNEEVRKKLEKPNAIASIMDQAKFAWAGNLGGGWGNYPVHKDYIRAYSKVSANDLRFQKATRYSETSGEKTLKEYLVDKIEKGIYGRDVGSNQITVTSGSTQASYQLIKLFCSKESPILTTNPVYANILDQAELLGVDVKTVNIIDNDSGFFLPVESEEKIIKKFKDMIDMIRPGLIYLVSPCNPCSKIFPNKLICEILIHAQKHNIAVVLDRAYSAFCYVEKPAYFEYTPNQFYNLICLESLSKSFSLLGERVGYVISNEFVAKNISSLTQRITLSPARFPQEALIEFLSNVEGENLREYINNATNAYKETSRIALNILHDSNIQHIIEPDAGFYITFKIPAENADDTIFCNDLLEREGVLCVPGSAFGNALHGWVRTSFAPHVNNPDMTSKLYQIVCNYIADNYQK